MKDLSKIMQQAQEMQAKMQEAQAKVEATEAEGRRDRDATQPA